MSSTGVRRLPKKLRTSDYQAVLADDGGDNSAAHHAEAGCEAPSQSRSPHTASLHPPQPVVARVASASCGNDSAPARQADTICPLETVLHRQITALDGRSAGDAASAGSARPSSNANRS